MRLEILDKVIMNRNCVASEGKTTHKSQKAIGDNTEITERENDTKTT